MSNMVYALERHSYPNLPISGYRLAIRQHLQSSSVQSARHCMAQPFHSLAMPRPAQQTKQSMVKPTAEKGPGCAWQPLLRPQTEVDA